LFYRLNPGAKEFKLNVGAKEFKPSSGPAKSPAKNVSIWFQLPYWGERFAKRYFNFNKEILKLHIA